MRIIIDIGHPAHVHLFRNYAKGLMEKGNEVLFTVRRKECNIELLEHYNLPFKYISRNFRSVAGKLLGYLYYEIRLLIIAFKFRPDIFISHGSFYAAHAAFLLGKKHISLEDTGNMEQVKLYLPFTHVVLTSTCFNKDLGKKQLYYKGYHELAYLHPNRYVADQTVLSSLQLKENEKYAIVRFVANKSSHDIGKRGLTIELKRKIVAELSKYIKVFISSEDDLPSDLKIFGLKIHPWEMHDAINYAELYIGDSATMASESAVSGVPAIYLDDNGRFYTYELEKKYGLVFNYTLSESDIQKAIDRAIELISLPHLKENMKERKQKLISDHIDVTEFLLWFTEDYPQSREIIRQNPGYLLKFQN
jgi:predicted glycosyltransferase